MPTMKTRTVLRAAPGQTAEREDVIVGLGDQVGILGTQHVDGDPENVTWTKIEAFDSDGKPTGWALTTSIDFNAPAPDLSIDMHDFARQCWWLYLETGANPYYLTSVGQFRSNLMADQDRSGIGPFRLSQAEWDAGRASPQFGLGEYSATDISDWRMQCTMFGLMSQASTDAIAAILGRQPTWVELYLCQIMGPKAAAAVIRGPNSTVDAAFAGLKPEDLPAGALTAEIFDRNSTLLLDKKPAGPGTSAAPPRVLTGTEALDQIMKSLQESRVFLNDSVDVVAG
jgi:hypothetical protein